MGLLAGLVALSALVSSPAAQAAEGEAQLAVFAEGGASLDESAASFGGGIDAWWGLDSWLWLSTSLSGASVSDGAVGTALGGLVLAADVLSVVPWIEGSAGALIGPGGPAPAGRLSLGVDYALSFEWSVGAYTRLRMGPESADGLVWVGGLRLAHRFEP